MSTQQKDTGFDSEYEQHSKAPSTGSTYTHTPSRPVTAEADQEEFPEGGWGWAVIAGCFILMGTNFGMINAYGEFQKHYLFKFPHEKQSVLTLIGSLQPGTIYLFSCFAGLLIQKFGPRYSTLICCVIVSFSFMMTSICKTVWQLALAQGILFGLGTSISVLICFSVPQHWFKKRRGTALGIMSSGSSIGGVLWPLAVQHLIKKVGFSWANRIIGFIYIPLLCFAAFAIRTPSQNVKKTVASNSNDTIEHLSDIEKKSDHSPSKPNTQSFVDWSVLKNNQFLLLLLGNAIGVFSLFTPFFFLPSYSSLLPNIRPSVADNILTILNCASIIGRILPGVIGDKIGRLNAFIIAVTLSGIFVLALWLPCYGEGLLLAISILYGISSGAFVALPPAVIGQLFGIKGIKDRIIFFLITCAPGCLVGPVIAGSFLPTNPGVEDLSGYNKLIIFSGSLFLGTAAILIITRLTFSRKLLAFV